MAENMEFEKSFEYHTTESGIVIPIGLSLLGVSTRFDAKIDTGSQFCIFRRKHAELLGLDVETGMPLRMMTATGHFDTFGHTVDLTFLGLMTTSTVYFAAEDSFYLNILGRQGWLDRVKLGLIDYEGKLLLSSYGG